MPDDEDEVVDDEEGTPPDSEVDEDAPAAEAAGEDETPEDKNWKDLQAKYPGRSDDEIRGIVNASYWEQTKALSASAKATRELELKVAKLEGRIEAGTPPAEEKPAAPPPEVQELDGYINSLRERDQQVANAQTDALKALSDAKDKVGEMKGLIRAAKEGSDEEKVSRLEARLETAEGRVDAIRDKLDGTVRERKDIAWNHARAQKERTWLTTIHAQAQANEESEREELETELAAIPGRVDATITATIDAAGMPADPALREDLRETLKNRITVDLWKAGKNMPFNKVDVAGLLRQYTSRYMKAHGIAKRETFKKLSEEKTRVSGAPPATPVAGASRPNGKPGAGPPRVVSAIGALPAGMLRGRRLLEKKGW